MVRLEEAAPPLGLDHREGFGGIHGGSRDAQGLLVQIRAEHPHGQPTVGGFGRFQQEDGQGIGLLAGGAPGHPGAQDGAALEAVGQVLDALRQGAEGFAIPEEGGDSDEQIAGQGLLLPTAPLQVRQVVVDPVEAGQRDPAGQAAPDRRGLVLADIQVGQQALRRAEVGSRHLLLLVLQRELAQGGAHLVDPQDDIHGPARDRRRRQLGVLGGAGLLGHGEASDPADLVEALRAILSGARQHDGHGALSPTGGHRLEERVEGPVDGARGDGHPPVLEGDPLAGVEHVGGVGREAEPVFGPTDDQGGLPGEQLVQVLVGVWDVAHEQERAAQGAGERAQDGAEGLWGASGGADRDDQVGCGDLFVGHDSVPPHAKRGSLRRALTVGRAVATCSLGENHAA